MKINYIVALGLGLTLNQSFASENLEEDLKSLKSVPTEIFENITEYSTVREYLALRAVNLDLNRKVNQLSYQFTMFFNSQQEFEEYFQERQANISLQLKRINFSFNFAISESEISYSALHNLTINEKFYTNSYNLNYTDASYDHKMVKDKQLRNTGLLTNLHSLDLSNTFCLDNESNFGLHLLSSLTNLQVLKLGKNGIKSDEFTFLRNLTNLTTLDLQGNSGLFKVENLISLSNLTSLNLEANWLEDQDVQLIAQHFPVLEKLNISSFVSPITETAAQAILTHPSLKILQIDRSESITLETVQALEKRFVLIDWPDEAYPSEIPLFTEDDFEDDPNS